MVFNKGFVILFLTYCGVVQGAFDCSKPPDAKVEPNVCCPVLNDTDMDEIQKSAIKCNNVAECDAFSCILKDLKVQESGKELDKEAFKKFIQSRKPANVSELILDAAEECLAKPYDSSTCKMADQLKCILKRTLEKCPKASIWNTGKNSECDTIRDYLGECGFNM